MDLTESQKFVEMDDSPDSPEGSGNSNEQIPSKKKQVSARIHWFFTWNNYDSPNSPDSPDCVMLENVLREFCFMYAFQQETGKSGTPHLQGVLSLNKRMRWSELGLPKEIHWGKPRNITLCYKYCTKADSRTGSVFLLKYKIPKEIKLIKPENMKPWQLQICRTLEQEPDDRTMHWFWSRKGGVGKTCFCKYLFVKYGAIMLSGKGSDMRNGVLDYYKKNQETPEVVVINIPFSFDKQYISYEGIENIKDMIFYSGKYEGGMVCGNSPHVIVFANIRPDLGKMAEDRWKITNIDESSGYDSDLLSEDSTSCLY